MSEYPITTSVDEKGPELKKEGPQPGPAAPAFSLNNRFIVETYKEDRALKATVSNGFAMVSQKVSVKGLRLLVDVDVAVNGKVSQRARKGDLVYIREASLQSQPWAKTSFTAEGIDGEFIIVDQVHVEFVIPQ